MLFIDASHPANRLPLQALEARGPEARPLTPEAEAIDPYYEAGCHPEIVAWMWERLAKKLPPESRCLVYGTPCLVQPTSGVIIAAGMGTSYVLRLLPESLPHAATFDCTPVHTWGGSAGTTDLRVEYGEGWVFGSFGTESIEWCRATFHHFNSPPDDDAIRLTPATPAQRVVLSGRFQLLMGPKSHLVEPDAQQIDEAVRGVDWFRFTAVVLRRDDEHFLEISGSLKPEDGLSARWVEKDDERIISEAPSLEDSIRLLQSYAADDSRWKTLVRWD